MERHIPEATERTAAQLSEEHGELEGWFKEIHMRARTGEPRECDAIWSEFTRQLEAHLAFEEQEVFPAYERQGPSAVVLVRALRSEHAAIREQMDMLGLDLQLHLARAENLNRFLGTLREHASRERESIYPFLAASGAGRGTAAKAG